MSERRSSQALRGRRRECETLDRLLDRVRAGESRALVLRGEPGVGKTALLRYVREQATDCRVARASGVQSEMELAFAGLHQLCAPMLGLLDTLPPPQRDALGTAFGLSAHATPPDRFLVGLAVLSLLSEVAEERPLVCLVDDAQWLDRASVQALAFVARRLLAESVAVVFAVRSDGDGEWAALPELLVEGLGDGDARALLGSVIAGPLDERVRDRVVAETRGNPLALMELPRGLSPAELAGGFGLPDKLPLSVQIEQSFRRRLEPLPAASRQLLLLAAAEPVGEPALVWSAAERLGIGVEAAAPATAADLAEFGARVRFRHPLVRSAVYQAASPEERRRAHGALADATDPAIDPDRRAWHRAHATPVPDEEVAAELEHSAGRAQARGGLAAAAAFLEQATTLTLDPACRADRALAAAQAKLQAGACDAALGLLATAQGGPLDKLQRARVDLLRAQIAFALSRGSDAPPLLLKAARQLEPLDLALARETHLDALAAAIFVGRLDSGIGVVEVARAARTVPPPVEPPRAPDLFLDGLGLLITEGHPAGTPMLKQALTRFRNGEVSAQEKIRWQWLACGVAMDMWDDETWWILSGRQLAVARDAGALTVLPLALTTRTSILMQSGELAEAALLIEEIDAVTEVTGSQLAPYAAVTHAAWRGSEGLFRELTDSGMKEVVARGEGMGLSAIRWATAVLYNGLGRYEDALAAAEQASVLPQELRFSSWGLVELIEAAARCGKPERAADAMRRLERTTRASGTDWARGTEARSRALLSDGQEAEDLYREAIERLGRTRVAVPLARAHLLYGEWLRRERRRLDARRQLRTAHDMCSAIGLDAFGQRAERELRATGETARKRSVEASGHLTAQEAQIARLARDGLSNPEIGARLFISPRTVEYHLRKVFGKLNVKSRNELARIPSRDDAAQPA